VGSGEILADLHAAPMAVHVAEAAHIHQDVEFSADPLEKARKKVVVTAAVFSAEVQRSRSPRGA